MVAWANAERSDVQIWLHYRNKPAWRPEVSEGVVAELLNTTHQAGIAILSGLVRNGWLESSGDPGNVFWRLTDEGLQNIEFFLYEPIKSPWET